LLDTLLAAIIITVADWQTTNNRQQLL